MLVVRLFGKHPKMILYLRLLLSISVIFIGEDFLVDVIRSETALCFLLLDPGLDDSIEIDTAEEGPFIVMVS
jgi:hypothetical protein